MNEHEICDFLKNGAELPPDRVSVTKDGITVETTAKEIIKTLFDVSKLTDAEKSAMMYMSTIPLSGIEVTLFENLAGPFRQEILRLVKNSWMILDEELLRIRLHPLICEAVLNWDETGAFFARKRRESFDVDTGTDEGLDKKADNLREGELSDEEIDKFANRFNNKAAGDFFRNVLTGRKQLTQGDSAWHTLNQITACYASKIIFRKIRGMRVSGKSNTAVLDMLQAEYKESFRSLNKLLTDYSNRDYTK